MIRFRLSGPSSPINENDAPSPIINPLELENILIDPFQETFVQAHLCPSEATTALSPTEWLVLDHAEDPFLDIGKGQEKDPPEVMEWDASSALSSSSGDNASALRVVGTRRDTAWIELTMTLNSSESSEENLSKNGTAERKYLAVPIAMQIEVGNGSWEASLIKRRDLPAGNIDIVTLDLIAFLS